MNNLNFLFKVIKRSLTKLSDDDIFSNFDIEDINPNELINNDEINQRETKKYVKKRLTKGLCLPMR